MIATPSGTHVQFVMEALKAGKHVVCDKPLSITLEDTILLIDTARACNRQLFVFQNRRWDGDFLTLQQLIKNKQLSSKGLDGVKWIEMAWQMAASSKPWKCDTVQNGGGRFIDLGVHMIDQCLMLFPTIPVKSVYCKMLFTFPETPQTDSHALLIIEFQNQTTCVVDTNCLATVRIITYFVAMFPFAIVVACCTHS